MTIRCLALCATLSAFAAPALAGGLADPVVEPAVIIADAAAQPSIGPEALILLSTLIVFAAAASN